jgi:hypothetical protein
MFYWAKREDARVVTGHEKSEAIGNSSFGSPLSFRSKPKTVAGSIHFMPSRHRTRAIPSVGHPFSRGSPCRLFTVIRQRLGEERSRYSEACICVLTSPTQPRLLRQANCSHAVRRRKLRLATSLRVLFPWAYIHSSHLLSASATRLRVRPMPVSVFTSCSQKRQTETPDSRSCFRSLRSRRTFRAIFSRQYVAFVFGIWPCFGHE